MKCLKLLAVVLLVTVLGVTGIAAQSLKGMSLNGATGLFSIPSGRIGWEQSSNLGLDFGYHAIISDGKAAHIPKATLSIFKLLEVSTAFDVQPENYHGARHPADFVGGLKVQLPLKKTALALGGNFQAHNMGDDSKNRVAGQFYAAATYSGNFFEWPAETTIVFGKTFIQYNQNWDFDFGMGFDMVLFPKVFENIVHWVTDFANFSYSADAYGADARYRGVFNTGLRFDLSAIPGLNKFKFVFDVILADAFDHDRAFSLGVVFGIPIL